MVAGGGIAGMEAARVAALRGHRVTLCEKTDELGGHLIEAAIPDFKDDEKRLIRWYKIELSDLNVEINLNTEVTPDIIQEKKIDAIIIATGSRPVIPEISGIGKDKVVTATDLLRGKKKAGENVVISGGGLIGCETALWLARQGRNVTIVEMAEDILSAGPPLCHANSLMLLDLLKFHKIDILTNAGLSEVTEDGVVVTDKGCSKNRLSVDTVVIATGLESDQELYRSLTAGIPNLYLIGDARQPRNIMNCIWDAYEIARNI
jgi:2-enoate reductase